MLKKLERKYFERVAEIIVFSYRYAYVDIYKDDFLFHQLSVKSKIDHFEKRNKEEFENKYIYESDGIVRGIVSCESPKEEDVTYSHEIRAFYLDPPFIGKGYGKKMYQDTEEITINKGYSKLIVWCLLENKRALDFYQRMGFHLSGKEREFPLKLSERPLIEVQLEKYLK